MGGPTLTIRLTVELDREEDGRWIAEVSEIPGVIVYGVDEDAAMNKARGLALNIIGERVTRGEDPLTGLHPAASNFKRRPRR